MNESLGYYEFKEILFLFRSLLWDKAVNLLITTLGSIPSRFSIDTDTAQQLNDAYREILSGIESKDIVTITDSIEYRVVPILNILIERTGDDSRKQS